MPFLAPIFHFKRSFYQDRLGTNMGKALLKKSDAFLARFSPVFR
eukprot:COSAG06_NODE_73259_length_160_cov_41.508197_1_plen_43_part_10